MSVSVHKNIHISHTRDDVNLNEEGPKLLAKSLRDRELKNKVAKQHNNRRCEGQEAHASSPSSHRLQRASSLPTLQN